MTVESLDQVRPDVNYYYTLKLWKKDIDQDIEEVVSGITYCALMLLKLVIEHNSFIQQMF